jgi:hypothetical protein
MEVGAEAAMIPTRVLGGEELDDLETSADAEKSRLVEEDGGESSNTGARTFFFASRQARSTF